MIKTCVEGEAKQRPYPSRGLCFSHGKLLSVMYTMGVLDYRGCGNEGRGEGRV